MSVDRITWFKTSATTWETPRSHRGYTAEIEYIGGTYTITITGPGAPGPSTFETLRNAKNFFRKYLFTKPVI